MTAGWSGRVYWQTHETNATARRLYDDVAELSDMSGVRHKFLQLCG